MSEPEPDKLKVLEKRLGIAHGTMEWDMAGLAVNPSNPMLKSTDRLLAYIGLLLMDIREELRKANNASA